MEIRDEKDHLFPVENLFMPSLFVSNYDIFTIYRDLAPKHFRPMNACQLNTIHLNLKLLIDKG